ncbi:MAG: hypothetical protein ACI9UK_001284 [Candidatus Krumholzibacteriia bacterium]|jgi:hypothetical protein
MSLKLATRMIGNSPIKKARKQKQKIYEAALQRLGI